MEMNVRATVPISSWGAKGTSINTPTMATLFIMVDPFPQGLGTGVSGPKYLLNFKKAGRFTFTEMTQINPNFGDGIGGEKDEEGKVKFKFSDPFEAQRITNEYSVAFFDSFVKGDKSAKAFVDKNHYPKVVAYQNGETATD